MDDADLGPRWWLLARVVNARIGSFLRMVLVWVASVSSNGARGVPGGVSNCPTSRNLVGSVDALPKSLRLPRCAFALRRCSLLGVAFSTGEKAFAAWDEI